MNRKIRMFQKILYLIKFKKCIIFCIVPWRFSFRTYITTFWIYPAYPLVICTWINNRNMIFFKKHRKLIP